MFLPFDQAQVKRLAGQVRFTEKEVLQQMNGKKLIEIDLDDYRLEYGDTGLLHEKKQFIIREFERMEFIGDTRTEYLSLSD